MNHPGTGAAATIAFANTKGGAGKTSAAVSLGYAFAQRGLNTLLVDLDDSCALTYGLHRTDVPRDRSVGAALVSDELDLRDLIIGNLEPGLSLLPANDSGILLAEQVLLPERAKGLRRLDRRLDAVRGDFDVIIVDTPGRLGTLQMGGVLAADWVIVPVSPRRDHVLSAQRALDLVGEARDDLGARVQVAGLLRTLVEKPHAISSQVGRQLTDKLAASYGVTVLSSIVPVESRYTESEFQFRPVGAVAPTSRTAIAYRGLADELEHAGVVRALVTS
ncbi:MAG: ParA family protein [Acidimicrobiia bacterium]